jgi:hypothetical protein
MDFIERYLGLSPDRGDGSFEAIYSDSGGHVNHRIGLLYFRKS